MSKTMQLFGCIFLILVSFIGAPNLAAESLSAYDFMKPATNQDLVISPSGRYVAFSNVTTDTTCVSKFGKLLETKKCRDSRNIYTSRYNIIIVDLNTLKKVRELPLPKENNVNWLRFANDDRLLVAVNAVLVSGRKTRKTIHSRNEVFSVPIIPLAVAKDNGYVELPYSYIENILRDDPEHVLMVGYKSGELDIWKVNIETGKEELVVSGRRNTRYWYTNKKGEPKLRYDCSTKCDTLYVFAENDEGVWRRIRTINLDPDEDIQDASFYPAAYSNNENQILIFSEDDDDERRSVKKYDFTTDSTVETVYEHPKYDVQSVIVDNRTEEYLGVTYIDDRRRFDFVDGELDTHFETIDRHFKGETNISFIGQSEDGHKAVIYSSSYKSPGGYYIYNFKTRTVQKLLSTEMKLESALNTDGDIMKITMRDGSKVSAYHYYPKGQKKGAPLLVMPHGGPHVRDSFGFDYWAQYFVSRGYQVVSMNFRGSSGYGKAFEEAGHGEWGGLMQDDITDTVKYFHNQNIATADKTCIVGFSYGGYAALYGGATTPELYECIVSGAGVSDLVLSMSDDKENLSEESYELMTKSMGDPKVDKARLIEKSPLMLVDAFEDPVLLLHGTLDKRVEHHHSKKMHKALKAAKKSVEYVEFEEVGHNRWPLKIDIEYLESIDAFLTQHIGD